jgi:undecaprenyl-diphosphatase
VIFGCLLALLGFSRIYLGWHHPSDVFFGWALGGVAGFGVHLFSAKD